MDPPDFFLTIPRSLSAMLLYWVVIEMYRERRDRSSKWAFWAGTSSALFPIALVLSGVRASPGSQSVSQGLVIVATILMAQGCLAQYWILKRSSCRGAVSLPMHAMLYGKYFSLDFSRSGEQLQR